MTQVRVWLLNEGVGWFRYWPTVEAYASAEETVNVARTCIRARMPKLKESMGKRVSAVAYEVLREDR